MIDPAKPNVLHAKGQPGPLAGIRVLSLAEQLPGPYATMLLADLGADVILVERPGIGDPSRQEPAFFASMGRNKRSVALDLKSSEGCAAMNRLIESADVLVEGFRPGVLDRIGFGQAAVLERKPSLVYVSITSFGQDGPYRDRIGHDISLQAVSGLLFRQAGLHTPSDVPFADLAAAMFAAFSVTTALFNRERTGRGAFIDVAMADCLVSWMTPFLSPVMNGAPPLDTQTWPGYGIFISADGRPLSLSIAHEDQFWAALCDLLDLPEHGAVSYVDRARRSLELRGIVANRIGAKSFDHWSAAFDQAGICWSPVNDLAAVAEDPHFNARGLFAKIHHDGVLERHVLQPLKCSRQQVGHLRPSPRLGEHNRELLDNPTEAIS